MNLGLLTTLIHFIWQVLNKVKDNLDYAKEIYEKVFLRFKTHFFIVNGRYPPSELEKFKI